MIEKYRDRFEMSNPGALLLSFDQLLKGGVSECRNKSLQQMFLMIGGGEKAGSGIDKIRQGWISQHWRFPSMQERVKPDRVMLILPMVSLLPEESLTRLQQRFGARFAKLNSTEVQALVTADVEGSVNNPRLREICEDHPADISKTLQGLAMQGFLVQEGQRRWSYYRLPPKDSSHSTPHTSGDSSHKSGDSSRSMADLTEAEQADLRSIAFPARYSRRIPPEESRQIITDLCKGRYLTAFELGQLMDRSPAGLRNRFLTPMVEEGVLQRKYPNEPNRPDQAYTAATD